MKRQCVKTKNYENYNLRHILRSNLYIVNSENKVDPMLHALLSMHAPGFMTMVQPAARAGAHFQASMSSG
jgi:hypothetical protein